MLPIVRSDEQAGNALPMATSSEEEESKPARQRHPNGAFFSVNRLFRGFGAKSVKNFRRSLENT